MKVETPFPMAFQMQPTRQGEEEELQIRHAGVGVGLRASTLHRTANLLNDRGNGQTQCGKTMRASVLGKSMEHIRGTNRT